MSNSNVAQVLQSFGMSYKAKDGKYTVTLTSVEQIATLKDLLAKLKDTLNENESVTINVARTSNYVVQITVQKGKAVWNISNITKTNGKGIEIGDANQQREVEDILKLIKVVAIA